MTTMPPGGPTPDPRYLPPAERAGVDTTEFKLALLSVCAGLVLIVLGIFVPDQGDLKVMGVSLVGGSSLGYGITRTVLKRKMVS